MPSVKLAKKAAALAVVKELHKAEELNDHLKQVEHKEEDSDEEDCNKMEMKKVMRAGTKRRVQYYLKQVQCFSLTIFHIPPSLSLSMLQVPKCFQNCHPKAGQEQVNYLYVFDIREADGSVYLSNNSHEYSSLGILTSKPIPHWRVSKMPPALA